MYKKARMLTFIAVLLNSALANAAWVNDVEITGVQALGDGSVVIYTPNDTSSVCAEGGKLFQVKENQNGVSSSGLKAIMSVAMVAYSSNKKVSIWYDDATSNCWVHSVVMK